MPDLLSAGDGTQAFLRARQALHTRTALFVVFKCPAQSAEEQWLLFPCPVAPPGHSWQVWNAMVKKALEARRHHEAVTVTEKGQLHNLASAFHVHLLSELGKSPKQRATMNFSQESQVWSLLDATLYHTPHLCSHLNWKNYQNTAPF